MHDAFPPVEAYSTRDGRTVPVLKHAGTVRIPKPRLLFALGRVPVERPFKPSRDRWSFEVAG